jgi:hypothetical protein
VIAAASRKGLVSKITIAAVTIIATTNNMATAICCLPSMLCLNELLKEETAF